MTGPRRGAPTPAGGAPAPAPVGVLGGRFDPIHYGHLLLAAAARDQLGLGRVLLVPAGSPPHRSVVAPAGERFAMALVAAAGVEGLEVSRVELDRPGPSYTVDTMAQLHDALPPGTRLVLVVGSDALADIPNWHRAAALLSLCEVAAAARPGEEAVRAQAARRLSGEFGAIVHAVDLPPLAISGADIRARLASGRPIRHLVPPAVEAHLRSRRLYR